MKRIKAGCLAVLLAFLLPSAAFAFETVPEPAAGVKAPLRVGFFACVLLDEHGNAVSGNPYHVSIAIHQTSRGYWYGYRTEFLGWDKDETFVSLRPFKGSLYWAFVETSHDGGKLRFMRAILRIHRNSITVLNENGHYGHDSYHCVPDPNPPPA